MKSRWIIGAVATIVALLLLPGAAASAGGFDHPGLHGGGRPTPGSAVVSVEDGAYGPVLVVGGAGAGYVPATSTAPGSYLYPAGSSLYFATIDPPAYGASWSHEYQSGCGITVVVSEAEGPLSCTGPETDMTADWPAFTTQGYPVAGPGVNPRLLGAVWRTDLDSFQVTYAGHPLYLFDPGPNSFDGANLFETVQPLPPWHTAWFLLSPSGTPATGPATLETESPQSGTTYTTTELATEMDPNIVAGGAAVSVYTFSRDSHFSHCYGACAMEFIPLRTVGAPVLKSGVNPSAVGVIWRADGTEQVTYNGKPLYIYNQEQPLANSSGLITTGSGGNGNGVSDFGGTFSLVTP
jgi:predicted lipoprotein with Yx(FWY)xxD motif